MFYFQEIYGNGFSIIAPWGEGLGHLGGRNHVLW